MPRFDMRVSEEELAAWRGAAGEGSLSGWLRDVANWAASGRPGGAVPVVGSSGPASGGVGLRDATGSWRCPFHPRGGPFTGPDVDCSVCAGLPVLVPGGTFEQVAGQAGAVELALRERGLSDLECGELLYRAVTGHGYPDEEAPGVDGGWLSRRSSVGGRLLPDGVQDRRRDLDLPVDGPGALVVGAGDA
jgi:hypothetical protein